MFYANLFLQKNAIRGSGILWGQRNQWEKKPREPIVMPREYQEQMMNLYVLSYLYWSQMQLGWSCEKTGWDSCTCHGCAEEGCLRGIACPETHNG